MKTKKLKYILGGESSLHDNEKLNEFVGNLCTMINSFRDKFHDGDAGDIFTVDITHDHINHRLKTPNDYDENTIFRIVTDDLKLIKRENFKPISDEEFMIFDSTYSIVKDFGRGKHLLSISSLIDSANTPSAFEYMKTKNLFFSKRELGSCIAKLTDGDVKQRVFEIDDQKKCV